MKCDVAIIGGGPAGSTAATLLRKYDASLEVVLVEREKFPRDHVGESQLPAIVKILDEMGVWDKIEAADFPVKIGGTYRWGRTDELWDFEFLPGVKYEDPPRPAKFEGQRKETAWQVDRPVYDEILLDHAASMGAKVLEETQVRRVRMDGDRVLGLELEATNKENPSIPEGEILEAEYFIDCSGETGILRRAMGIEIVAPTKLRNLAFWDYWTDAEWAVTIGNGGTRIQIMSLGWGWMWFIPISKTRTSVGLVVPGEYFKKSGKTGVQLYMEAIAAEPLISHLCRNAEREGKIRAMKDWNFLAERLAGENWFMAGDSCGFADPILSAGMTLAHTSGKKVAYTILELRRGKLDGAWLREQYSDGHRGQIRHHMQFADYWYSANGRFTDLREYCSEIASSVGLSLEAEDAFRWLAAGGFALEDPGFARALSYPLGGIKFITSLFSGERSEYQVAKNNVFKLNLVGATKEKYAVYLDGKIEDVDCYRRGNKMLPVFFVYWLVINGVQRHSDAETILKMCMEVARQNRMFPNPSDAYTAIMQTLESMIVEGWVIASRDDSRPLLNFVVPEESGAMHPNRDNIQVPETADA